MRINFVLPNRNPSGGVKVVLDYAKWLNENGHDCVVYYSLLEQVKHRYRPLTYTSTYLLPRGIRPADITLATAWDTAHLVSLLPEECGVKAYFIQNYEGDWGAGAKETYDYYLKQIVISHWLYNKIYAEHSTTPYIVENGIRLPEERPYPKNENPIILMPWRAEWWKGTEDGMEVLNAVHEKHPECEFHVFGWNIMKELVPDFIQIHSDISDEEVSELMWKADIFFNPTYLEGFGLPSLEAMSRKCAVVTTDVGAVHEYTGGGLYARVVRADVRQMALAITGLIENPEIMMGYQVMGCVASWRWGFEDAAKRFEKCLISLVQ